MGKRSLRTLYELMDTDGDAAPRARPAPPPETARPSDAAPASSPSPAPASSQSPAPAPAPSSVWTGSRVLRIPAGWLLLAIAGVLLVVVLVFMIGHRRGEFEAKSRFDERLLGAGIDPAVLPRDPLTAGAEPETDPRDGADDPGAFVPGPPPAAGNGGEAGRSVVSGETSGGPVESDPRRAGRHYLVLAETRPDGAVRLAEFLRSEGLDAYVVTGHNARLRRVIVLPGFESPLRTTPDARAMIERVERTGRLWKQEHRGASDLSDMYMLRFDG